MEETPDQFGDLPPDVEPTGNTVSCYICGMSFAKLNPEYVIRRDHQYDPDPKSRKAHRGVRYFLSFCIWCAHSYKL